MSGSDDTSTAIEPVHLSYALHLLPPGRISFRRWRWELWHGPRMLAAGWRLTPQSAQRALRLRALRYAHRLHGLHPLRLGDAQPGDAALTSGPVTIEWGELRVVLTPQAPGPAIAEPVPASG